MKTLEQKTEWILQAGFCYRCLTEGHIVSDCKTNNPMQYMQGQTPQRTPSQRETEETWRWSVGRVKMHIPVLGQ